MKKKIKSYLVFTSVLYRLLLFVLVPLAIIIVQALLRTEDLLLMTIINAMIYPVVEVVLDYWVFGGIAVKGGTQLEYIKSSKRGVGVIGTALGVDMARQFFTTILLFVANIVILMCQGGTFELNAKQIAMNLLMVVFTYFLIVTELTIVRHLDSLQLNLIISCFAPLVLFGVMVLAMLNVYVMLAVLVALSMVSSILGVKLILKRVKESYYDKTA